jgi:pimeloyl-ACP methyl ester carboxylesterase
MERVAQKRSGIAAVAGAELYYEVRGRGPAVLLIAGATGDAGHFEQAADVLASEHTVITYDRRGNSREPPGWSDHARSAGRRCGRAAAACRC